MPTSKPAREQIPQRTRILIVDDHSIVREGLASIVNRQPDLEVVGESASGQEALSLFRSLLPDVLLLDLRMPDLDGIEVIERLCSDFPNRTRILVLTTYDTDHDIHRCLKAGARGFLLKDTPREDILAAIRAVAAGRKVVPPGIAAKVIEHLQHQELTPRETEVLQHMALGQSNKEIGVFLHISEGTAKTHVNSIIGKLDAAGRTEAVTQAVKRGIVRLM